MPEVVGEAGADAVFVAEDFGPYGRERDERVAAELRLREADLVRAGSPYAVPPGEVRTQAGEPYKVFTPFSRAWRTHGWPDLAPAARRARWAWSAATARSGRRRWTPSCPSRARPRHTGRPAGSSTVRWPATPTLATGQTSTPPRGCRRT